VIVRMNATDYVKGGLAIDDAVQIASVLSTQGVDALSITSGTMCESVPFCLYPTGTPKANLLPMAARIRSAVTVPVIVAGRIRTPETARAALASKQADLIGLGRPFLSDPDWVRKTEIEDEAAILLCAACHQAASPSYARAMGQVAFSILSPAMSPNRRPCGHLNLAAFWWWEAAQGAWKPLASPPNAVIASRYASKKPPWRTATFGVSTSTQGRIPRRHPPHGIDGLTCRSRHPDCHLRYPRVGHRL
jgi:tRNA-dihydrouridine synthase